MTTESIIGANGNPAEGCAGFQERFTTLPEFWGPLLRRSNLGRSAFLARGSTFDPGRLVVVEYDRVLKLIIDVESRTAMQRNQNLSGEHEILAHLRGVPGVPRPISFVELEVGSILEMEKVPGDSHPGVPSNGTGLTRATFMLVVLLHRMALRGIAHNDIKNNNVIVGTDRRVWLIDYDQASFEHYLVAMARGSVGWQCGSDAKVHGSILGMLIFNIKRRLRNLTARLGRRKLMANNRLPHPRDCSTTTLRLVRDAWQIAQQSDANAPGLDLAYYALDVGGVHFPGERPWEQRWQVLRTITDFSGKRILELGCNMGLLATHLAKHSSPSAVMGTDIDEEILRSAEIVMRAYGVEGDLMRVDFDDEASWEEELEKFSPDIVFALNVVNWVKDKERLLRFLGRFSEVVVEGHDSYEVESLRLREVGFSQIRLVAISERGRPLIYGSKMDS